MGTKELGREGATNDVPEADEDNRTRARDLSRKLARATGGLPHPPTLVGSGEAMRGEAIVIASAVPPNRPTFGASMMQIHRL